MEGPANTVSYFIAGYVVIFGTMLFYLISLAVRSRNLKQDKQMLEELNQPEENLSVNNRTIEQI